MAVIALTPSPAVASLLTCIMIGRFPGDAKTLLPDSLPGASAVSRSPAWRHSGVGDVTCLEGAYVLYRFLYLCKLHRNVLEIEHKGSALSKCSSMVAG